VRQHLVSAMIGAAFGAACTSGLAWMILVHRPAPLPQPVAPGPVPVEAPSAELPAQTFEDSTTIPPENVPSEPDPQVLADLRHTLEVYQQSLEVMVDTVRLAHDAALDARRELSNLISRAGDVQRALGEIGRTVPRVRQEHTTAVQRLIELANGREDRATADQLWRELGQFEASLGQMETQVSVWLSTMEEVVAALRPDLDARLSTVSEGEQVIKSWKDFRAQWRNYLLSSS